MPSLRLSVLALIGCWTHAATAVCLLDDYSVLAEYTRSDAVITAIVVDGINVPPNSDYYDGTNYTITVREIEKGMLPDQIVIYSENSSGRFLMEIGEAYFLFISKDLGQYTVDNCGNSGLLRERKRALNSAREIANENAGANGGT